jgi:hypothetical protein
VIENQSDVHSLETRCSLLLTINTSVCIFSHHDDLLHRNYH